MHWGTVDIKVKHGIRAPTTNKAKTDGYLSIAKTKTKDTENRMGLCLTE